MSQKPPFVIPTIDVVKLLNKEYFYDLKRKFLSLDFVFEDQELFEDFMHNPESNLIEDKVTIRDYEYEGSEEVEGVDKNGVSGISDGKGTRSGYKEVVFDFYTDYIIPGLDKGKKTYLLGIKKSLVNADKFKEHILIGFFSEKKIEIRTALEKITEIQEFEKRGFNTELENNLYQILSQINSCEQMYFPIDKIHLDLDKVQVLFLFHALTTSGIIKGLSSAKLYMLVEKYFTYGKNSLPISAAYKAIADYFPSEKQSKARKKISKKTFDDLDTKFNTLFDFLKE
jgi:hypothetical protein